MPYTPPKNDQVDFTLESYTPPGNDSVDFTEATQVQPITGTGVGTESYTWDSEAEWQNATFSDTATDGSGNLILADIASPITFDYDIEAHGNNVVPTTEASARVEIRDADTDTVIDSASVGPTTGDQTATGTLEIDVSSHPNLEFTAEVEFSGSTDSGSASASLSGEFNYTTQTIVSEDRSVTNSGTGTFTDSNSNTYLYTESGTWTGPDYVFDTTTTATKLEWSGLTLPNAGDSVVVRVENSDGSSTYTETLSAGSGGVLFDLPADSTYRAVVEITTVDDGTTPSLGSLTLETHTPVDGHTLTENQSGDGFILNWNGVAVADQYQLYRNTDTPVTENDTLVASPTSTQYEDTDVDVGIDYYYNVRAEYTGE